MNLLISILSAIALEQRKTTYNPPGIYQSLSSHFFTIGYLFGLISSHNEPSGISIFTKRRNVAWGVDL
jgi:hypothetical protein